MFRVPFLAVSELLDPRDGRTNNFRNISEPLVLDTFQHRTSAKRTTGHIHSATRNRSQWALSKRPIQAALVLSPQMHLWRPCHVVSRLVASNKWYKLLDTATAPNRNVEPRSNKHAGCLKDWQAPPVNTAIPFDLRCGRPT